MRTGKVVLLVVGVLLLLPALALLIGGGALVVINTTHADPSGYLTTRQLELSGEGHALVSETARLERDWGWTRWPTTTVKVEATSDSEKPVFIGVAPEREVRAYLEDVPHDVLRELSLRPERIRFRSVPGAAPPEPPEDVRFWDIAVSGPGTQTLVWDVSPGAWVLVVMNADGSSPVRAVATLGIRIPWMTGLGTGMLIGGAFLLLLGGGCVILAVRGTSPGTPDTVRPSASGYPITLTGELSEPLSPALWLLKWLLLVPHYIALAFLWAGFVISWIASLVAIVVTGRYPRGLFAYNVGVLRWTWRVGFYGMQAFGTDRYPPFTLQAGGYPADVSVVYPEQLSRGLALVKWWLLAFPQYVVIGLFQGGGGQHAVGGLVPLLVLFAGVALLFRGRYPRGIFDFVMQMNRWTYRVLAYAALMTDRYPPFRLED